MKKLRDRVLLTSGFAILLMLGLARRSYAQAGTLYGVWFVGARVHLVEVDPETGTVRPRVATGASTLAGGICAYDAVGNRFFFVSESDLYTVNTKTGLVTHANLGGRFPLLQFDPFSRTLFGVYFLSGQIELFAIDPETGAMTPRIATGASALVGGVSAFDPIRGRFFFMSDPDLYVVNVRTSVVTHTDLGGNYPLLQFDPVSGTLYGIYFLGRQVQLFAINPETGAQTPSVATGATTIVGGISAFDPITGRFFFMSDPDLYTVNTRTGVVKHTSLGGSFPLLQFAPDLIAIPALAPNTLMVLVLALAAIASFALRGST